MNRLEIDLRVLTPAFVRGAEQSRPELREASFKGQLRWWYRAWNPLAWQAGQDWAEGRILGGTREGEGQCPFVLRLRDVPRFQPLSWSAIAQRANRGNQKRPGGLRYLGFSLGMKKKNGVKQDHRAVPPDVRFKAVHLFRDEPTREQVRGLLAAWWLLAHLGGVGARSRRGFGSLVLEGWRWPGQEEHLEALPLPATASKHRDWAEAVVRGLDALERWAPARTGWPAMAPQLGPGSQVVIQTGWRTPKDAHERAGQDLSAGRRAHRGEMNDIDDRVTFGLPLETGKRNKRSWRPGSFRREPIAADRHASPLHLHVGAWRGGAGLCWALLAGPRPGIPPYRVREAHAKKTIRQEAGDAVGAFVSAMPGARWEASEMQSTWLHLDVQGRLGALPPDLEGRPREVGYRALGGPPIGYPVDTRATDWKAVRDTISGMADAAREDQDILVGGKAPLPAFAWLGFSLQPWAGARQVLVNQRKDRRWDVIDLSQPGDALFDEVTGLDGGQDPGLVAVFVSVMGTPPDESALRRTLDELGRPCAGVVTVRTRARTTLDAGNGPGAAHQLTELLSQVPGAFPKQQGVALFVAGPASLAFMAGRAVNPNQFAELHLPNYAGGAYLPAIRHVGPYRWRWALFLAHAGPDQALAERLFDLVDTPDRRVFLASRRLRPGDDWDRALPQAQRDSRVTVVLVSGRTDRAYYQREEIAQAIDLGRRHGHRVVPVYLPGSDRDAVPYGLRLKHGITVDDTADLEPLAQRLHALLDDLGDEG